jgi:CheY-like chemotaxis protein
LLVDDDSTLRASCSAVLEGEGYDLTLCGRADEALDLLRREPFDIVILDWYMTGVPGTEILRATLAAAPRGSMLLRTVMCFMTGASGLSVLDSSVSAPLSPGGVHLAMSLPMGM